MKNDPGTPPQDEHIVLSPDSPGQIKAARQQVEPVALAADVGRLFSHALAALDIVLRHSAKHGKQGAFEVIQLLK